MNRLNRKNTNRINPNTNPAGVKKLIQVDLFIPLLKKWVGAETLVERFTFDLMLKHLRESARKSNSHPFGNDLGEELNARLSHIITALFGGTPLYYSENEFIYRGISPKKILIQEADRRYMIRNLTPEQIADYNAPILMQEGGEIYSWEENIYTRAEIIKEANLISRYQRKEMGEPDIEDDINRAIFWLEEEGGEVQQLLEVGGIVSGKAHTECDEDGCGETFHVQATQKDVELEGGELVINKTNAADENEYEVKGTPKEIASAINSIGGNGVIFDEGAEIKKLN